MNSEKFIPGNLVMNIDVLAFLEIVASLTAILAIMYVKRRTSGSLCFLI